MKKKITLREIASIAKVSPATASIVLNDKKNQGISDKTWNKVKKIAQKFYFFHFIHNMLPLPLVQLWMRYGKY